MNSAPHDIKCARDRAQFESVVQPRDLLTGREEKFLLSIVVPARDEELCLESTVMGLVEAFASSGMLLQLILVDDNSTDGTRDVCLRLSSAHKDCLALVNTEQAGFGMAVRKGLDAVTGDGVAIVMADGADDPADAVSYARLLARGWDCVFGSRFLETGSVDHYPLGRLVTNRLGNKWVRSVLRVPYDDMTNAFKAYSREALQTIMPLESEDFSLTIEMPMKTVNAGFRHAVLPVKWHGRSMGKSKWRFLSQCASYIRMVLRLQKVGRD